MINRLWFFEFLECDMRNDTKRDYDDTIWEMGRVPELQMISFTFKDNIAIRHLYPLTNIKMIETFQ